MPYDKDISTIRHRYCLYMVQFVCFGVVLELCVAINIFSVILYCQLSDHMIPGFANSKQSHKQPL